MSTQTDTRQKVTVRRLAEMKKAKEKIACLTAYDASFAQLLEKNGVDVGYGYSGRGNNLHVVSHAMCC